MVKKKLNINLIITIILFFNSILIVTAQQEPIKKPRVVLTNDEFSTSPPINSEKNNTSDTPKTIDIASTDNPNNRTIIEEIPDVNLQFKLLDLQLALAQDPQNQILRQQQIEINTQIRQAPLIKPSSQDLQDLSFRQRYIELKIALITIEKEIQATGADIQQERRKIIKGSQGNSAFEAIREAENRAEGLNRQMIKLRVQLDALIEEGRRLGVGARVFR